MARRGAPPGLAAAMNEAATDLAAHLAAWSRTSPWGSALPQDFWDDVAVAVARYLDGITLKTFVDLKRAGR